jgi:hypothetical protein
MFVRLADELGAELTSLTMLRHPTEVVRSRDSAYLTEQTPTFRRQRETANVAAWVNAAFATEAATRAVPRAFVRYDDLLSDWRTAMSRAGEQLGLSFEPGLDVSPHPVDDFIDATLNRSAITWDDIAVPPALRDLAERTWQVMNVLVYSPSDAGAIDELAGLQEEYGELFDYSEAISMDATTARVAAGRRDVRRKKDAQIDELRAELDAVRAEVEELRSRPSGISGLFRR